MAKFLCSIPILLLAALVCDQHWRRLEPALSMPDDPQKIVSLAPAITETLFALGLGDRLVGVTEFCNWPPQAAALPKVGGFREFNLEAVVRSGADLVILPADMAHHQERLRQLGIYALTLNCLSLDAYLRDIAVLGRACGRKEEAANLIAQFKTGALARTGKKPRILFALLNPDEYARAGADITVIGDDGFYDELMRAAGGENACQGQTPFPRLSLEAVLRLRPDILVLAAPGLQDAGPLKRQWQKRLDARLLILADPGDTIPGPRALQTLQKLRDAIAAAKLD